MKKRFDKRIIKRIQDNYKGARGAEEGLMMCTSA